jgi:hypothetical protein
MMSAASHVHSWVCRLFDKPGNAGQAALTGGVQLVCDVLLVVQAAHSSEWSALVFEGCYIDATV